MNVRQLLGAAALVLLLSGCAAVSKVATGDAVVGNRLALKLDTSWNQFERGFGNDTPTWTVEGVTVDALQFYVGIKDGQPIAPSPANLKGQQPLNFKASMQPADVVALYQSLLTRDGSSFQLDRLEPAEFLGGKGFRFEYSLNRKIDDVPMRGMAYGAVRNGELFVIHYTAPRLVFFPRYQPRVEALARGAQLKG
jgi:hypothetical protein